eukprot:11524775-Heterocapsa_arctica.AAC.1
MEEDVGDQMANLAEQEWRLTCSSSPGEPLESISEEPNQTPEEHAPMEEDVRDQMFWEEGWPTEPEHEVHEDQLPGTPPSDNSTQPP